MSCCPKWRQSVVKVAVTGRQNLKKNGNLHMPTEYHMSLLFSHLFYRYAMHLWYFYSFFCSCIWNFIVLSSPSHDCTPHGSYIPKEYVHEKAPCARTVHTPCTGGVTPPNPYRIHRCHMGYAGVGGYSASSPPSSANDAWHSSLSLLEIRFLLRFSHAHNSGRGGGYRDLWVSY